MSGFAEGVGLEPLKGPWILCPKNRSVSISLKGTQDPPQFNSLSPLIGRGFSFRDHELGRIEVRAEDGQDCRTHIQELSDVPHF